MGLWSFMKDSGKKLFGGDDAPDADALKKEVADLGLEADGVDIEVEGDKVKVNAAGVTQSMKEKIILAVGNVAGVASVEAEVEDEAVFHTVEKGDTLSAIALKTMGSANYYHAIFAANKQMLSHPD